MTEDSLTNLLKISIERNLFNELMPTQTFYQDIIVKFAGSANMRFIPGAIHKPSRTVHSRVLFILPAS